jgi:hypothetical protein
MSSRINPTRRFCPKALPLCLPARPINWKRRLNAGVALQVGQVDQQIRLPLRRFGYGRSEISPSATLELKPAQQLCPFTARKVMNLMNIRVADNQAKQRLSLF